MSVSLSARRDDAFTLIELLIVVAIIAILAAIAVPNFLEAQTRSKVSRVLNDLRTMRTAVESYSVDSVKYPRMTWGCFFGDTFTYQSVCEEIYGTLMPGRAQDCAGVSDPMGQGGCVTTPVAYLSSLFFDPFADGQGGRVDGHFYTYWNVENFREHGGGLTCYAAEGLTPGQTVIFDAVFGKYTLWSYGPAGYAGYLRRQFFEQYDPSNGTYSDGSVFVGQKFFEPMYVNPAAF